MSSLIVYVRELTSILEGSGQRRWINCSLYVSGVIQSSASSPPVSPEMTAKPIPYISSHTLEPPFGHERKQSKAAGSLE